jgi:hypothetical protein
MKLAMIFLGSAFVVSVVIGFESGAATMAAKSASEADQKTIFGDIIDNRCASANKEILSSFVPKHTKSCALAPDCKASGYSIYSKDGRLVAFRRSNDRKIVSFLEKKNSKLQVVVVADQVGDSLNLVSIKEAPVRE